jgi:hypothetical protein
MVVSHHRVVAGQVDYQFTEVSREALSFKMSGRLSWRTGRCWTEGWRLQHEAWVVQHRSIREAVHELKGQTAILSEILELLRSRTP